MDVMSTSPNMRLTENRYRYEALIDSGGMGTVYRVYDRLTQRSVALKRVRNSDEHDGSTHHNAFMIALAREFTTMASLRHPHIVSVLDYGFDVDENPYFTMELLENPQSITQASNGSNVETKITLLLQTLQGLAFLHRHGVLHRDLKPGNIQVVNGAVKILDFGLAVMSTTTSHRYRGEAVSGTYAYTAPEVYSDNITSRASDLFAVGVVAYEMLVGAHPFEGDTLGEVINNLMYKEVIVDSDAVSTDIAMIIERLLEKAPIDRYQDAEDVIRDLSQAAGFPLPLEPMDVRDSLLHSARFVGRESELAILTQAMNRIADGEGSCWLVGGESGVGKTRLIDELRILANVRGMVVVQGQVTHERGILFQGWLDILRYTAITADLTDFEASVLKTIIPDIDALVERHVSVASRLAPNETRVRLLEVVTSIFQRLTKPLVLIIEDLQWARESLILFNAVTEYVQDLPLLMVGTFRDDDRPDLPSEVPYSQVLTLNRLSSGEIKALSMSILGDEGSRADIVGLLVQETEGNALFVIEVIRELAESVDRLRDVIDLTLPQTVFPKSVQALLQSRIDRLPEVYREVLNVAAVVGKQLDLQLLYTLHPHVDLSQCLLAGQYAALIDVHNDAWRFAHDKVRQTLLEELAPQQVVALHHQVAEALEEIYPGDVSRADRLAMHWQRAGHIEKALEHVQIAAQRMVDISNFHGAIELIDETLVDAEALQNQELGRLHLIKGDAYRLLAESDNGRVSYERALAIAQMTGDAKTEAQTLSGMGLLLMRQGNVDEAVNIFRKSLSINRKHKIRDGIAEALSNLAVSLLYDPSRYETAHIYLREALAIRRELGNPRDIGYEINNIGALMFLQKKYEPALRLFWESLTLRREAGDREGEGMCLTNIGVTYQYLGDYERARDLFEESLVVKRRIGDKYGIVSSLSGLVMLSLRSLRTAEGVEPLLSEAAELVRELGLDPLTVEVITNYAWYALVSQKMEHAAFLAGVIRENRQVLGDVEGDYQGLMDELRALMDEATMQSFLTSGSDYPMSDALDDLVQGGIETLPL